MGACARMQGGRGCREDAVIKVEPYTQTAGGAQESGDGAAGQTSKHPRVGFLGVDFDVATLDEAVREIVAGTNRPFSYVVTPNVHHIVKMNEMGDALVPAYRQAWRTYCDSRILAMIARWFSIKLPVVTGSDLTPGVLAEAERRGLQVAIVGPEAEQIAVLQRRYPGLRISLHTPPMGFIKMPLQVERCVAFVEAARAPITLLAVGMPQQELLAARIAARGRAIGIGLCIGASIDFLTGRQNRAPVWMQNAHLEWLYRLFSEPRRMASRYLIECPRIFALAWRWKRLGSRPTAGIEGAN